VPALFFLFMFSYKDIQLPLSAGPVSGGQF
jgi:hypothetical protein